MIAVLYLPDTANCQKNPKPEEITHKRREQDMWSAYMSRGLGKEMPVPAHVHGAMPRLAVQP